MQYSAQIIPSLTRLYRDRVAQLIYKNGMKPILFTIQLVNVQGRNLVEERALIMGRMGVSHRLEQNMELFQKWILFYLSESEASDDDSLLDEELSSLESLSSVDITSLSWPFVTNLT